MHYEKRIIRIDNTDVKIVVKHEKLFVGDNALFHTIKKRVGNSYKIQNNSSSLVSDKEIKAAYEEAAEYFESKCKTNDSTNRKMHQSKLLVS